MSDRQQRTVFGEVAATYDRVRADYPNALIDDLISLVALTPRSNVLDVGCGTGILASRFLDRGHKVLGIEPSASMARVAITKFTGEPDFGLEIVDFQDWQPDQARFDLVVAGQSWHWLDPATRFGGARDALTGGGHLALLWNTPEPTTGSLGDAIGRAYQKHAPALYAGPPGSRPSPGGASPGDEIRVDTNFVFVKELSERWSQTYSSADYGDLLSTQSNHRLLADNAHRQLIGHITEAIDDIGGGAITVDYTCRAYIARRA